MRFYELGTQIGIEKKDIDILLRVANESGFDIKNSLATVDDRVVTWAQRNSDELAGRVEQEREKAGGPAKKRVPVKKKAVKRKIGGDKDEAGGEGDAGEDASAQAPAAGTAVQEAPVQVAPEQPAPVEVKPAPVAQKVVPPHQAKSMPKFAPADNDVSARLAQAAANLKKKKKAAPKAPGKPVMPVKHQKGPVVAPAEGGEGEGAVLLDEQGGDKGGYTTHKHKRADFKGTLAKPELPAIFSSMDSEYTRSIRSGGTRGGRGGRSHGGSAGGRRKGKKGFQSAQAQQRDPNQLAQLTTAMSLRDLSEALGVKLNSIMSYFMQSGKLLSVNDILGEEDIALVAEEFQIPYEWKQEENLEQRLTRELDEQKSEAADNRMTRPPVVTFMGHVDHGKTSLLDKIRQTRVAEGESGGITQHIGAYSVEKNGHKITFLDTPGHEAFTQMRARGANLTDVVVLVVAADDGVMPQTKEAYNHAKNAGVPVVVAINKCDLASANPDKVRQELANQLELMPEEWGGTAGMIDVSAHTGQGIDKLLERILLEAEMLELDASPERNAVGYVIESEMTENRGVVATVLILDGTLHRGDVILTSNGYGKVKLMYDWNGRTTDSGGPSQAVSVVGLNNVPEVGDKIFVVEDMVRARKLAEEREYKARAQALSRQKRKHVTLENLTAYLDQSQQRELNVILKADVTGSLEVLEKTLADICTDEVRINVIHSGVGGISQADVILADAGDAIVLGFHVVADSSAKLQATSHNVQIKVYHIIYRLIEDMKAALEGMLPPEEKEVVRGHVEIREIFRSSRLGNIAGCYVLDGVINRSCRVRLIRDNVVIYDGNIDGLRRFKDDVKEVRSGFECGLRIVGYDDIKVGDVLEAYEIEEIARKLD